MTYQLGGDQTVRAFLYEYVERERYTAKQAYLRFCSELRKPEHKNINKEEALALYEKLRKEEMDNFILVHSK